MDCRILLLGKDGQVGTALQSRLEAIGIISAYNRATCDLCNADQLRDVIRSNRPNVIVNAAAYTAVDKAEAEPELCHRVNAEAPGVLALEAKALGAWLVHYSTDYVFDGCKQSSAYAEGDTPSPLNTYGRTKLAGELAIAAATEDHTILRVSWIYSAVGRNFAKTILKLALEREELRIVNDQFGAPTSAHLIACVTDQIIRRYINGAPARGIFNVSAAGYASWHQFAVELLTEAKRQGWPLKLSADRIIPIATSQYPTPAARPKNSTLDTARIRHILGFDFPPWQEHLEELVSSLC